MPKHKRGYIVQIKICTEYQDMASRAKVGLSGTWPEAASLNQGLHDKPAEALGTMSRYSAQISIFYCIHFPIFIYSLGWVRNLTFSLHCHFHYSQNEAVIKTNQITQHRLYGLKCCDEVHSDIYATELTKLTDDIDKIRMNGKFFKPRAKWMDFF